MALAALGALSLALVFALAWWFGMRTPEAGAKLPAPPPPNVPAAQVSPLPMEPKGEPNAQPIAPTVEAAPDTTEVRAPDVARVPSEHRDRTKKRHAKDEKPSAPAATSDDTAQVKGRAGELGAGDF